MLCLMRLKRYSLKYPQLLRKNVNLRNQRFCNISALNISHLGSNGYVGWHTLDIECKGVLSIGGVHLLVENRVGVGLTRSTIRHLLLSLFPFKGASK